MRIKLEWPRVGPGLSDGSGAAQHAHSPLHLGRVSAGDNGAGLLGIAHLKSSPAPIHKLDGVLGLHGGNSLIEVFWDHVPPTQHALGHVPAIVRFILHHLAGWFEAGIGDLGHGQLVRVGLLK